MKTSIVKYIAIGGVLFGLFIVGLNSFTTVTSGHTGVITNFGAVSDNILQEGLHFKAPFITKIVVLDNRTVKVETSSGAASKDLQTVSSKVAVNYRLNKDASAKIYKNVGKTYESTIVAPAIQEAVKSVTARFTAEELINKRQDVSTQIKEALQEKIGQYGLTVENFNIVDFDFSAEFNKAVEAKQTAQQNALKAEQDLSRIKIEAQQQIEQAKAEAEALKLKAQQVTPEMIQMEFIKKWDGKLPTVSGGGNILDLGSIIGKQ